MLKENNDNRIVNALWIGKKLGPIEELTIKSFVEYGHQFRLWVYDELESETHGAVLYDANEVLSRNRVFRYPENSAINGGRGGGSYAGFSDVFRYKLLADRGGWWVDMDVTCLRPLLFSEPYFFRNHARLLVVGNVMKVPACSELMRCCYETASRTIDCNNDDWHKPIVILCDKIKELKLDKWIKSGLGNIDMDWELEPFFRQLSYPPRAWYFIHWCHTWNSDILDVLIPDSFLWNLFERYDIELPPKH
jgi:hypothetical protein